MSDSGPDARDRERTRWGEVLIAFAAGVLAAGHIGKLPAAIPLIRGELGLDLLAAGWVVSIFNAMSVALGIVMGHFADRLGHRRTVIACLFTLAAGSLWGALAGSGTELLWARFAEGVGFVGTVVAAPSIIAQAARTADRRFALGLWGAFMGTGIAAMLLIAPTVLAPWGWRGLWLGIAAASAAWALVAWIALRRDDRRREQPRPPAANGGWLGELGHDVKLTLCRPGLWLLAMAFALYTLQWMALMVWLPTFLIEQRGASVTLAAHLTVIVVLVNVIGNLLGGWLLQRGQPRWRLLAFVGLLSLGCGLGIFSDALADAPRYGLCILFSGLAGMLPAAAMSGAPAFAPTPRQIGAANGLLVQGSNLGQLIGTPAVAIAVALAGGWHGGSWIFIACGIGGLALALALRQLERH